MRLLRNSTIHAGCHSNDTLECFDEGADATVADGKACFRNRGPVGQLLESDKHAEMLAPLPNGHAGLPLKIALQRSLRHTSKPGPRIQVPFTTGFLGYLFNKSPQLWIFRHRKMQGLLTSVLYLVAEHCQKMLFDFMCRRILLPL